MLKKKKRKNSKDQNTKMDTHSFVSILSNDLGEAGSQSKYMSGKGFMKEVSEHYQSEVSEHYQSNYV